MQKIENKPLEKKVVDNKTLDNKTIDSITTKIELFLKNNGLSHGECHLIVQPCLNNQTNYIGGCNDFLNHNKYKEAYFLFNKELLAVHGYEENAVNRWVEFLSETFKCFTVYENIEHEVYSKYIFVKVDTSKFSTGSYSRLESKIATFALRAPFRSSENSKNKPAVIARKKYFDTCLDIKSKYPSIEAFECLQLGACLLQYDSNLCADYYFNGNECFSNMNTSYKLSTSMMPAQRLQSTELLMKKLAKYKDNVDIAVKTIFHYPLDVSCERIIKLYNEGSILEVLSLLRDSKLHPRRNLGFLKNKDVYVGYNVGKDGTTIEEIQKNGYSIHNGVIIHVGESSSYYIHVGFPERVKRCSSGLFSYANVPQPLIKTLTDKYGHLYKDFYAVAISNMKLIYPKKIIK